MGNEQNRRQMGNVFIYTKGGSNKQMFNITVYRNLVNLELIIYIIQFIQKF